LGKMLSSSPSTSSTEWNRRPLPPRGDRVALPSRDLPPLITLMRCLAAGAYWACWGRSSACASRALAGGSARCGAPSASRWSPPSAAPGRPHLVGHAGTASPCRPGMHLGAWWVCTSSFSSGLSHWPRSLTNLVKISEPSSQILLCAAAAWYKPGSVKCGCAIVCDELSTSHFLCQYTYWHKCYSELCSIARFS
jgi:hypothetical protein